LWHCSLVECIAAECPYIECPRAPMLGCAQACIQKLTFCSIVHCYPTRQLVRCKLVIVHSANANSFSLATTTAKAITRDLFRGRYLPFLLSLSFLSSPLLSFSFQLSFPRLKVAHKIQPRDLAYEPRPKTHLNVFSLLYRPPRSSPLTSDNTSSSDPEPDPSTGALLLDTVNHKMHKIWSVDSQENY